MVFVINFCGDDKRKEISQYFDISRRYVCVCLSDLHAKFNFKLK